MFNINVLRDNFGGVTDAKVRIRCSAHQRRACCNSQRGRNERCIRALEELDRKGSRISAAERRLAELLTLLIENFEETHYALEPADPVTVIAELMSANGLKQKDLPGIFGTSSIVSEVLNGKRRLTTEHIRRLSRRFHASADVFI